MRCARCSFENQPGSRFCAACGNQLARSCPRCHADVAADSHFCPNCGASLTEPEPALAVDAAPADGAAPPRGGAPFAERRLVSVLFCDLVNFTALAESLDPEEVRDVLSRYFDMARALVTAHGGMIEKFIGDAVMALWGAPTAHEDDAERAVRVAIALVAGVERLGGAAAGSGVTARAAVATGEAAVMIGVEGQGMVAGDLVNTAARLQGTAPASEILVDDVTRRMTEASIAYASAGALELKGKSHRLPAWRVTGPVDPTARQRAAGHPAPFVGREAELQELTDLYHATSRDGRCRLVTIMGIAGIGKSRLAWELGQALDSMPTEVAWHVGRTPSYGQGTAFAPLAEMVRRRAGIVEAEEREVERRRLGVALSELVRNPDERAWLEPRLGVLLDPSADAAYEREELFSAWRRCFELVAQRTLAVLVFEDLQWADPELLDFIEHLAEWSRHHPILVIGLARLELLDRRPAWGAGLPSFTAITLDRLSDDAMDELLAAIARDVDDATRHRIRERADGVPLFAVEMVRMLLDREQAAVPTTAEAVPEGLHALIAARIDGLPPSERSVLLSAAVLGRRFDAGALAAVAATSPGALQPSLRSLVRRELLAVDEEPRSPGLGQLTFVQDLVREVAYRTVARRERRALHLAAASYLESLGDEELTEALAAHLVEAHRAGPAEPDTEQVAGRAVAALQRAAQRALRLHAPDRALEHADAALGLGPDGDRRAELLDTAAEAARQAGRFDIAEGHLKTVVDLHTATGDRVAAATATARLGSTLASAGHLDVAVGMLSEALAGMSDQPDDRAAIELAAQLARAQMIAGDHAAAIEHADRALKGAGEQAAVAVDALVTRGTARISAGNREEGLADLNRAIADADAAGLLSAALRARSNLAYLSSWDDPHAALDTGREGLRIARLMGMRDMAWGIADACTIVAFATGEWDWALETIAELEPQRATQSNRIDFAGIEAMILASRGDTGSAEAALERIWPIDVTIDPVALESLDQARAWVAFASGRLEDALGLGEKAAVSDVPIERHSALKGVARAALWLGDAEAARRAIERLDAIGPLGRAAAAERRGLHAGLRALGGDRDAAAAEFRIAADELGAMRLPVALALLLADRHRLLPGAEPTDVAEGSALLDALGAHALRDVAFGPGVRADRATVGASPAESQDGA
jgi:class 3 adenylate cyclase/tetratricopeptide (TPR) repeat protein